MTYNIVIRQENGELTWASYQNSREWEKESESVLGEIVCAGISEKEAIKMCDQNSGNPSKNKGPLESLFGL